MTETRTLSEETFLAMYDVYIHAKVMADMYDEGKWSTRDGFGEGMRDLKRATDIVAAIHERALDRAFPSHGRKAGK